MEKIKVTWTETDIRSVEIPLAQARQLYNDALAVQLDSVQAQFAPLGEAATAGQVAAALRQFNDLANQLADFDAADYDGPYRDVTEVEVVS